MIFVIKKIIGAFVTLPGLIILLLLLSGIYFWVKKMKKAGAFNIFLALFLWVFCVVPISHRLLATLEKGLPHRSAPRGDVIVVLHGAGNRLGPALELQKELGVPIVLTGFNFLQGSPAARRRYLASLEAAGIPSGSVVLETETRDTLENIRFAKKLCQERGFQRPLVITAAFHGKRVLLGLKKIKWQAILVPVDFSALGRKSPFTWRTVLPEAKALLTSSQVLNEYLGLFFYGVFY